MQVIWPTQMDAIKRAILIGNTISDRSSVTVYVGSVTVGCESPTTFVCTCIFFSVREEPDYLFSLMISLCCGSRFRSERFPVSSRLVRRGRMHKDVSVGLRKRHTIGYRCGMSAYIWFAHPSGASSIFDFTYVIILQACGDWLVERKRSVICPSAGLRIDRSGRIVSASDT